jgi:transcriptional regulator with XRE-family HTH domain
MTDPQFSLALQAEQHDGLLAPMLRAYLKRKGLTAQDLAIQLDCSLDALARLWLCEQPKADQFAADVQRIAFYIGVNAKTLARLLEDIAPPLP